MMTFKTSGAYQVATNSIKPVSITRDKMGYVLVLPEGDLYENKMQRLYFDTFEEAKRYAETTVGMKMNMENI